MKIYAITGKKQSGKSTYATQLKRTLIKDGVKVKKLAFATPLKDLLRNYKSKALSDETKEEYRIYLQEYGDLIRGKDENFFITSLANKIQDFKEECKKANWDDCAIIVDDVRYPNELIGLNECGDLELIICEAKGYPLQDNHPSEDIDKLLDIALKEDIQVFLRERIWKH